MDDFNRIIIAGIIGAAVAFGLNYFFGNLYLWTFICLAFALATETSLRTIKNVGPAVKFKPTKTLSSDQQPMPLPSKKPDQPHF
jgi:hypothetical protein